MRASPNDMGSEPGHPATADWSLHPQLAADTINGRRPAAVRASCSINDANYPWLMLVPRREGLIEIIDLDEERAGRMLMREIAVLGARSRP